MLTLTLRDKIVLVLVLVFILVLCFLGGNYVYLESYDYDPVWSSDSQQLLFVCHRLEMDRSLFDLTVEMYPGPYGEMDPSHFNKLELCVVDLKTGAQKWLTRDDFSEINPAWSPDNSKIVFAFSAPSGDHGIGVIHADGSHFKKLTHNPGLYTSPEWSPAGDALGFSLDGNLYLLDEDTGDIKQLTRTGGIYDFEWSNDGKRIVFVREENADSFISNIYIINVATGLEVKLTDEDIDIEGRSFVWSPDNHWIAFVSNRENDLPGIYLVDALTGKIERVADGIWDRQSLSWSPDGRFLAYLVDTDSGESSVKIFGLETKETLRISRDYFIESLRWSPDGRYLALVEWDDWNNDSFKEPKVWLLDLEKESLIPISSKFPWTREEISIHWNEDK